jgi:hypothetical protein
MGLGTCDLFTSRDCVVCGGLNATFDHPTSLCVAKQDTEGVLAAGKLTRPAGHTIMATVSNSIVGCASCQLDYSPTNGSCIARGGGEDWRTFLRFYRRNATITSLRSDLQILSVSELSNPQPPNITPPRSFHPFGCCTLPAGSSGQRTEIL